MRRAYCGVISILLSALLLIACAEDSGQQDESGEPETAASASRRAGDWAIFRGDPGLSGSIGTSLPDRLYPLWRVDTDGEVKSSPVIKNGVVYVGSGDQHVYAIDAATGESLWSTDLGAPVEAAPMYHGASLFVGTVDGLLYALEAGNGDVRWSYETGGQIVGSANLFTDSTGRATVLVGSYDSRLHGVDAESGEPRWTYESGYYINGAPALTDDRVLFGGCDALLHVVSLQDGEGIAEVDTGAYVAGSPAYIDGRAYVANFANKIVAIDIAAAEVVWEYENEDPEGTFYSSPASDGESVVVGGRDGRLICVDALTGAFRWSFTATADIDSSPVIAGNRVVCASMDGFLYILDIRTGKSLWSYEIGSGIVASPAVAGDLVVVGSEDGAVYGFGGKQ